MKKSAIVLLGALVALLLVMGCSTAPAPAPKAEAPKAEAPKAAAPKEEPKAKVETTAPKAEAPKTEAPKPTAVAKAETAAPKAAAAPKTPAKLETVNVGVVGGISDAAIYVALERGYFQQEGLTANVVQFSGIPAQTPPLSTGEIDVGGGIIASSAFNAIERGVKLKLVADKSSVGTGKFQYGSVVIRKDLADSGAIKEIKDLKGKKIGVSSLQSGVEAEVSVILQQAGMTIKDVDLVQLGYPDAIAALGNKAIDAAWLIEPSQTQAVDKGFAVMWEPGFPNKYLGGVAPGASMVYSEKFIKNVDLGRKFMVVYLKGVRDYLDAFDKGKNKADMINILVKNTNLKDAALYDKMRMTYIDPNGRVDAVSGKVVVDYLKKMGYYAGKLNFEDLVDMQFSDYAVQKLGKY